MIGLLTGFSWILTAAAFVRAKTMYAMLPDRVPTHWNWRGEVDGWMRKPVGAYIMPLAMLAIQAFFTWSRLHLAADRAGQLIRLVWTQSCASMMLFYTTEVMLRAGTGEPIRMNRAMFPALALFLVALIAGIVLVR